MSTTLLSSVVLVTLSDGSSVALASELVDAYKAEAQAKGLFVKSAQMLA